MGNFQQHITCSTTTGIVIGGTAYCFGVDPAACLVAAGLCSFAGMLPDIDSNSSKSFRECIYLAASIGGFLTVARLWHYEIDADIAMFCGAMILLFIRFGVGAWIKKITVHRGMIHSIPMAILLGQLTFFVATGTIEERLLKAAALAIGFLSHLVLDEIYSIDSTGARLRLKRSFGTALKWTNPKRPGPVALIYASVLCLGLAGFSHPDVIERRNGGMELAEQTPTQNEPLLPLQQFLGSVGSIPPSEPRDLQREAAEFLALQELPAASTAAAPHTQQPPTLQTTIQQAFAQPATAELLPLAPVSELPAAMQIDNEWNQHPPTQHARIRLQ